MTRSRVGIIKKSSKLGLRKDSSEEVIFRTEKSSITKLERVEKLGAGKNILSMDILSKGRRQGVVLCVKSWPKFMKL